MRRELREEKEKKKKKKASIVVFVDLVFFRPRPTSFFSFPFNATFFQLLFSSAALELPHCKQFFFFFFEHLIIIPRCLLTFKS